MKPNEDERYEYWRNVTERNLQYHRQVYIVITLQTVFLAVCAVKYVFGL